MSFLAPLYLLAALGVALPIIFHLIQRKPRQETVFSSLLFLSPSPPKLVRRSRIDQWLLLLLRALALVAIAFAFMRPFLRENSMTERGNLGRQRLLLVDTSASMQRKGVWDKTQQLVQESLSESAPGDLVALYQFDSTCRPVISFESIAGLASDQRSGMLKKSASELRPTSLPTDLGGALVTAAETIKGVVNDQNPEESIGGEIIVISDFSGANSVAQLEQYQWPSEIRVVIRSADLLKSDNAVLSLLGDSGQADNDSVSLRLQIRNSINSERTQFQLRYLDPTGKVIETEGVPYQVNAGESRIISLKDIPAATGMIELIGDLDNSDNRIYVSVPQKQLSQVWLVQSPHTDATSSLGFYIERLPLNSSSTEVSFKSMTSEELQGSLNKEDVDLIVADSSLTEISAKHLRDYVQSGGKAIISLDEPITEANQERLIASFKVLLDTNLVQITEGAVKDYVMWNEIDFRHPLLLPLSDSRFNDFTKVRFWRYRRIELDEALNAKVLAAYDNRDPGFQEINLGSGRCYLFSSGWQPEESQLALSTKFVPILVGIHRYSAEGKSWPAQLFAGDVIDAGKEVKGTCVSPSGAFIGENAAGQWKLDEAGIYQIKKEDKAVSLAVNVAPLEFDMGKLDTDRLEQLGVSVGALPDAELVVEQKRQMRNTELESQQQVWRWCIVAAICFIAVESIWSNLSFRKAPEGA